MKVILLQDDKKLGKKGQIIEANDGFARNYILPKKIGVEATPKNLNDLKLQKANEDKIAQQQLDAAKELAAVLETKQVVVKMKAGEGGRVYLPPECRGCIASFSLCIFQGAELVHERNASPEPWTVVDGVQRTGGDSICVDGV